jgi:exonuclease VII small subunit
MPIADLVIDHLAADVLELEITVESYQAALSEALALLADGVERQTQLKKQLQALRAEISRYTAMKVQ